MFRSQNKVIGAFRRSLPSFQTRPAWQFRQSGEPETFAGGRNEPVHGIAQDGKEHGRSVENRCRCFRSSVEPIHHTPMQTLSQIAKGVAHCRVGVFENWYIGHIRHKIGPLSFNGNASVGWDHIVWAYSVVTNGRVAPIGMQEFQIWNLWKLNVSSWWE